MERQGRCTGYCYQVLWCALQGTAIGYLHIFVAGIVTARVFVLTAMNDADTGGPPTESTQRLVLEVGKAPVIFRYGGIIGYIVYALLVIFADYQLLYLFYHNGGILPLMVLIILGCAVGADPAARYLFRSKPLLLMSRFSYSQYLLQESVWDFTSYHIGVHSYWGQRVAFPVILLASAYLCERFLTSPYSDWQRWRQEKKIKGIDDWAIEKADLLMDRMGVCLYSYLGRNENMAKKEDGAELTSVQVCPSRIGQSGGKETEG
jgi:peptidoglycan/LPS O-acetylase OafA/YrhL